jgi:hypothetical protein
MHICAIILSSPPVWVQVAQLPGACCSPASACNTCSYRHLLATLRLKEDGSGSPLTAAGTRASASSCRRSGAGPDDVVAADGAVSTRHCWAA